MWTMRFEIKSANEFGHEVIEKHSITSQHEGLKGLYDRLMSVYIAEGKKVQTVDLFENDKQVLRAVMRGHVLCIANTNRALATWIRERMRF